MKRTKEEAEATRRAVLKAALGVFSAKGYSAATLDDIARAAGVTRGAVYWHFKGKADLYTTLMQEVEDHRTAVIQQAVAQGGTFIEVFRRILIGLLESVETHPDVRAVMELSLFRSERLPELEASQERAREAYRQLVASIASFIELGIAAGELRADLDPVDAARAVTAFQQGLTMTWLYDPAAFSLRERAPALADIYLLGIT